MLELRTQQVTNPDVIEQYGQGAKWVDVNVEYPLQPLEFSVVSLLTSTPLREKETIGVGILTSDGELRGGTPEKARAFLALSESRGTEAEKFDPQVMEALRKLAA